jgi:endonuclease-3
LNTTLTGYSEGRQRKTERSKVIAEKAFNIDVAMRDIEGAVKPYPKAAMFELADSGFGSPFEQLVACMISIRTTDEVSLPTARRLFEQARSPAEMVRLRPQEIDRLIQACSFHERKAQQIHALAERLMEEYDGELPCERPLLLSFDGVGPKCANLTLGVACGQAYISVDIHVHRVTNRWGYVEAATPEKTMTALEHKLPREYWLDINRLLVPFGKHICTGQRPRCSTCPLLDMCEQIDVKNPR